MKADLNTINTINTRLVMKNLFQYGPISKADIARNINLSLPSVMKIIDNLISKDLVTEVGKGVSTGGKPPDLVDLKKYSYYSIGIEINPEQFSGTIINLRGEIILARKQGIDKELFGDMLVEVLISFIENILKRANVPNEKYLGISICIEGEIDVENGVVICSDYGSLSNVGLAQMIKQRIGISTHLISPIYAKALAEAWFGDYPKSNHYLFLDIDNHVKSALILNGKFQSKGKFVLGNIEHFTVNTNGLGCSCGGYGCLATYFNEENILNTIRSNIKSGRSKNLANRFEDEQSITMDDLMALVSEKDIEVIAIISEYLTYVARAVDCLYKMSGFEYIICSGRFLNSNDVLFEQFETILKRVSGDYKDNPKIYKTDRLNSGAIGAAALLIAKLLDYGCNVDLI